MIGLNALRQGGESTRKDKLFTAYSNSQTDIELQMWQDNPSREGNLGVSFQHPQGTPVRGWRQSRVPLRSASSLFGIRALTAKLCDGSIDANECCYVQCLICVLHNSTILLLMKMIMMMMTMVMKPTAPKPPVLRCLLPAYSRWRQSILNTRIKQLESWPIWQPDRDCTPSYIRLSNIGCSRACHFVEFLSRNNAA